MAVVLSSLLIMLSIIFFLFLFFFSRVDFLVLAKGNGWAFGDEVRGGGGRTGHTEFVFVSVGPLRGLVG